MILNIANLQLVKLRYNQHLKLTLTHLISWRKPILRFNISTPFYITSKFYFEESQKQAALTSPRNIRISIWEMSYVPT